MPGARARVCVCVWRGPCARGDTPCIHPLYSFYPNFDVIQCVCVCVCVRACVRPCDLCVEAGGIGQSQYMIHDVYVGDRQLVRDFA